MNEPLVSIIMGAYNCEETVAECIDSIINQTYQNWEFIICDDCSSDNTIKILEEYESKDSRIKIIRNEKNMKLAATLNHCLEVAKGQYIARMDADDISLPQRLEKELEFLENHQEYDIVSCPMIYFDQHGDFMRGKDSGEPIVKNIAKGTPFCHAPCFVRRKAYEAVNGYAVAEDRLRLEDWDLWIRMYEKGFRGYNLEEPLYKMRDDHKAYSRRKFVYRINEAKVGVSAVKKLKLNPIMYVFCIRPIIVGLLPAPVYNFLHRQKRIRNMQGAL